MSSRRRKAWFVGLARRYVRRKLAGAFAGVNIAGLDAARELVRREPVIVAANHAAWWDALGALRVDELLGTESYCLMDAVNLGRLPFFGWAGAIPLDNSSPRTVLASLRAAMSVLKRPGRALWIFPQGEQRPAHLRPLQLQRGVELLAARSGAPVLPMALSYDFLQGPRPELNISFAADLRADGLDRGSFVAALERRLVQQLDRIDQHLVCRDPAFVSQLRTRGGDTLPAAGRALALLGRGGRCDD